MSFFGFDTSLPRDKPGSGKKGIFEHNDAFGGLQQTRKLQAFQNTDDEMYVARYSELYAGLTYAVSTSTILTMALEIN